ncbi:MAG: hydrogenase maturation protease [Cyclobacteriaceae bacterium]
MKRSNPKILIAGVGNELKQDDAFGILMVRELLETTNPHEFIKFQEVGIGGIHLVQELHEKYDILVILDAVNWGGEPGQIYFRSTTTADLKDMPKDEQRAFLADMHYTNPVRAMMLAKALNVLPNEVFILGCEAKNHSDFDMGISEEVKIAIPLGINKLRSWLSSYNYSLN